MTSALTLRDPSGWTISTEAPHEYATVTCMHLTLHNVPILGDTSTIHRFSSARLVTHQNTRYVIVSQTAAGGGCVSCKQHNKKIVPSPIIHSLYRHLNGNPQVQAVASSIVNAIDPPLRLYDLETISPHSLVDPYAISAKLMELLLKEGFYSSPEHYKFRHRLLSVTRKYLTSALLKQIKKHHQTPDHKADSVLKFARSIHEVTSDKPADFDSHIEAQLFLQALADIQLWPEWLDDLDKEGSNVFSAYFGGPPLQYHLYILGRVQSLTKVPVLAFMMLVDQLSASSEKLAKDLLLALLSPGYTAEPARIYYLLAHLDYLVGTFKVSEVSYECLIAAVRVLLEYAGDLQDQVRRKAYAVLERLRLTPGHQYALKGYTAQYSSVISQRAYVYYRQLGDRRVKSFPIVKGGPFKGRSKDLASIQKRLAESQSVVFYGREGMGKSRLASEYALQHQDEYDIVYWVAASSPEKVLSAMVDLGQCLGLVSLDDIDDQVEYIKAHIDSLNIKTLLVFDDAPTEREVSRYAPQSAHVIMTTSNKLWRATHKLDGLKKASKVSEEQAALQVYGGSPLCLSQAGYALLLNPEVSFEEFHRTMKQKIQQAEARNSFVASPFFLVMHKRMAALKRHSEKAADFLYHLCFLHPSGVHPMLYCEVLKVLGYSQIGLFLRQVLVEHMFVDIAVYGDISINPSVADWIRSDVILKEPYMKVLTAVFHRLASNAFALQGCILKSFDLWSVHFENVFSKNPEYYKTQFMESLLYFAHIKKRQQGTLRHLWISEPQLCQKVELNFRCYQMNRHHIAILYLKLTQDSQVRELEHYLQCLYLQNEMFNGLNAKHADLAEAYHLLGKAYCDKGMPSEALIQFQEALNIRQQIYPKGHLSLASSHQELAEVCQQLRRPADEAIRHYDLCLSMRVACLFGCHPLVSRTLLRMAQLFQKESRHEEAAGYYQRAFEAALDYYGETHPEVAYARIAMADSWVLCGRGEPALEQFKLAAGVLKQFNMPSESCVLQVYLKISSVCKLLGDVEQAMEYREKGGSRAAGLWKPDYYNTRKDAHLMHREQWHVHPHHFANITKKTEQKPLRPIEEVTSKTVQAMAYKYEAQHPYFCSA